VEGNGELGGGGAQNNQNQERIVFPSSIERVEFRSQGFGAGGKKGRILYKEKKEKK